MLNENRNKYLSGVLAIVLVSLPPRPSYAILSELTSAASGEGVVLAATLIEKLEQGASIYEILESGKKMLQVVNEVAAASRTLVRMSNRVSQYGPEALLQDALNGLSSVYPELGGLRREVDELIANGQSLEDGSFLRRYSYHDSRTDRAATNYSKALVKTSVTTLLGLHKPPAGRKLTPVEAKVLENFERAGDGARHTFNETAMGAFAQGVRSLRKAARKSAKAGEGSLEDQLLSASLAARAQAAKAQARRVQMREVEAAFREAARQENSKKLKTFEGGIRTAKPNWKREIDDAEK